MPYQKGLVYLYGTYTLNHTCMYMCTCNNLQLLSFRRCLHLALQQWSKDSKITSRTLTIITSHTAIQEHQNVRLYIIWLLTHQGLIQRGGCAWDSPS